MKPINAMQAAQPEGWVYRHMLVQESPARRPRLSAYAKRRQHTVNFTLVCVYAALFSFAGSVVLVFGGAL